MAIAGWPSPLGPWGLGLGIPYTFGVVYIIINGNFFQLAVLSKGDVWGPTCTFYGWRHPPGTAGPEQTSICRRSKSTAPPIPPALRMLAVLHAADNNDTSPITWSNYFQKAPNNAPSLSLTSCSTATVSFQDSFSSFFQSSDMTSYDLRAKAFNFFLISVFLSAFLSLLN
jgi:hypothetical protein